MENRIREFDPNNSLEPLPDYVEDALFGSLCSPQSESVILVAFTRQTEDTPAVCTVKCKHVGFTTQEQFVF